MKAAVLGAGPAGLMAAEVMARGGLEVSVYEALPSPARKFLMAGKSGLNLTLEGDFARLLSGYGARAEALRPALEAFDNHALMAWAEGLGQPLFVGSTGRVFPRAMKASPLLRAWLRRLEELGVTLHLRHRGVGWEGPHLLAETAGQRRVAEADVYVLACGGASWPRLGSDGEWAGWIGTQIAPFRPANMGLRVQWSEPMQRYFGAPLKGVAWRAGEQVARGEAVISRHGLEGGGIYSISGAVRDGAALCVDLVPDLSVEQVAQRLARPRGKASQSTHLRKALRLDPVKRALIRHCLHPVAPDAALAPALKAMPVPVAGVMPLARAISSAGGVPFGALDDQLMLRKRPGVFCAGEMLDWEAPTGGWLLSACFATGAWAGCSALRFL